MSQLLFFVLYTKLIPLFFVSRNICHGSDSVDTANREIKLWFKDEELVDWEPEMAKWIYE